MLKNFCCYQLSLKFFRLAEQIPCKRFLRDQLERASSAIPLNLAEGSERVSDLDRRRFYRIAMSSLRECQAILDLLRTTPKIEEAKRVADELGANVFRL